MKTVTGESPHASWCSEERFSTKVRIKGVLKERIVEIRIGGGTRSRIAQLQPAAARQLAHELIENAANLEAKIERSNGYSRGWKAGFNRGYGDGRREMRQGKKRRS